MVQGLADRASSDITLSKWSSSESDASRVQPKGAEPKELGTMVRSSFCVCGGVCGPHVSTPRTNRVCPSSCALCRFTGAARQRAGWWLGRWRTRHGGPAMVRTCSGDGLRTCSGDGRVVPTLVHVQVLRRWRPRLPAWRACCG